VSFLPLPFAFAAAFGPGVLRFCALLFADAPDAFGVDLAFAVGFELVFAVAVLRPQASAINLPMISSSDDVPPR
jgi:hypothetical protein